MFKTLTAKFVSIFLLSSLLAGCGFHFRGEYFVPEDIATMSLTSFDQYSTLTRLVDNELQLNGINLVPPSATVPNLHLMSESVGERTLSLYQNSRAAEKELTYRARYRVTVPNQEPRVFSSQVTRSYLDNPLTVLAKSVERDQIEDEMRAQATYQIIRQLARLKDNPELIAPATDVEIDFDQTDDTVAESVQ